MCLFVCFSKRFQSLTGQENIAALAAASTNGGTAAPNSETPQNLDAFKQEMLQEIRKEIQKAKMEIIEGKKPKQNIVS